MRTKSHHISEIPSALTTLKVDQNLSLAAGQTLENYESQHELIKSKNVNLKVDNYFSATPQTSAQEGNNNNMFQQVSPPAGDGGTS